jgi:UDP-N-acetylmuramoyl-L-alanine---L-glutamate ligase
MRFSELEGARIGVWGAGREISSFARQLGRRLPGARIEVVALDAPGPDQLAVPAGARVVTGGEIASALSACDAVVRSPGVSVYREELQAVKAAGVPVTTATALWLVERGGRRVLGVTGTKGKSTTAALAAHLARRAGVEVSLAGNIGVPALDLLDEDPAKPAVVELSSYQIADLEIGPEVALVTNLYREHVDWHRSEQAYRADKLRILTLPGVEVTVLNARDPQLTGAEVRGRTILFGAGEDVDRLRASGVPLKGKHNLLNLSGALAGLEALGIQPPEDVAVALADFAGLPHRLQEIADLDGVTWVDDSISTTPESALAALASYPDRDVILIGGGQDRGQDYSELARALGERKATVIGIPTTGARLIEAARAAGVPPERALDAADLHAAVELARERAGEGAVVLLSPAAPSYDHFENFEARGEWFQGLVRTA